ncbi:uncharacterized protein LOC141879796 isoform X12 [Acropora palmata]|uniref:uncharacterized protein LOC141879796 isoform X12 n=1 Tax=Acropora palmata TaxID=6131 RepID=UPI003DA1873E
MASNVSRLQEHEIYHCSRKLQVTILASEWGSSKGGLSTINRELAIQLAKFSCIEVTFFLPKCSEEDKKAGASHGISILEAKRRPGFTELESLCFPPENLRIDVVVGHGVKLGHQAQVIRESHKCRWVQVVHTDPEELGMFKCYENPISTGEEKHHVEVELCQMADFVVGVGPKLAEAFGRYLGFCKEHEAVFEFTPSIFDDFLSVQQVCNERKHCNVLVFGRGDAEDFKLKGFDIAARSVAAMSDTVLVYVGAPQAKHEEIARRFVDFGIAEKCLRVRGYMEREALKQLFCEVDLVLMPSRTEGFGLTGLEALSAGLPVIISKNSGFGEALGRVPFGSFFVVDSEDPIAWTGAIKGIWNKDRKSRLDEVQALRGSYSERYSWSKQCKSLIEEMFKLVDGTSSEPKITVQAMEAREQKGNKDFTCKQGHSSRVPPKRKEEIKKRESGQPAGTSSEPVTTAKLAETWKGKRKKNLPGPSSVVPPKRKKGTKKNEPVHPTGVPLKRKKGTKENETAQPAGTEVEKEEEEEKEGQIVPEEEEIEMRFEDERVEQLEDEEEVVLTSDGKSETTSEDGNEFVGDFSNSNCESFVLYRGEAVAYCFLKQVGVHLISPPGAVAEGSVSTVRRWNRRFRSPLLSDNEAVVSDVIELSLDSPVALHFDKTVTLVIPHCASALKGYEVVVKCLSSSDEWKDVETADWRTRSDIKEDWDLFGYAPDFSFPVAACKITQCSTFAVVCRLKSHRHVVTSQESELVWPEIPLAKVTFPQNAVPQGESFEVIAQLQEVCQRPYRQKQILPGPILRITSSKEGDFLKPIAVQLPLSLSEPHRKDIDMSVARVRILFKESSSEKKEWIEITEKLETLPRFDGNVITFAVSHFSWYRTLVDWCHSIFPFYRVVESASVSSKSAFFAVYVPRSTCLHGDTKLRVYCIPTSKRCEMIDCEEKQGNILIGDGSSIITMCSNEEAYVFLSEGIVTPLKTGGLLVRLQEEPFLKNLPVRVENQGVLTVSFCRSKERDEDNMLCELDVTLPPSINDPDKKGGEGLRHTRDHLTEASDEEEYDVDDGKESSEEEDEEEEEEEEEYQQQEHAKPTKKKGKKTGKVPKLLGDLCNDSSDFLNKVCESLDAPIPGLGSYEDVAKHYGYDVVKARSRFQTFPGGPSNALILAIIAEHPDVTVESFARVVVKQTRRENVARLLREFDRRR